MPSTESAIDADGARVTSCASPPCVPSKCAEVPAGVMASGVPRTDLVRYTWLPLPPPQQPPDGATPEQLNEFRLRNNEFLRTRSYRDGVEMYYAAEIAAADAIGDTVLREALTNRRQHFRDMAEDHGVNENTAP